jgi:hypothetical protein
MTALIDRVNASTELAAVPLASSKPHCAVSNTPVLAGAANAAAYAAGYAFGYAVATYITGHKPN